MILRNEEERHVERQAQRSGGDWRVEAVESWAGAEDVGRRRDVSRHMTYARKAKCRRLDMNEARRLPQLPANHSRSRSFFSYTYKFPFTQLLSLHIRAFNGSTVGRVRSETAYINRGLRRGELSLRAAAGAPPLPTIPPRLWGFPAGSQ
jgi:hypothetical protein